MLLRFLRKKLKNLSLTKWERKNKETLRNLMTFDTRTDQFPEELQKSQKLGYLLRNKKWLYPAQFTKWYNALTFDLNQSEIKVENESDLVIY